MRRKTEKKDKDKEMRRTEKRSRRDLKEEGR